MSKARAGWSSLGLMAWLLALPWLGVLLKGDPAKQYLEFPPQRLYVQHAGFSWPVFILLALLILAVLAPVGYRLIRARPEISPVPGRSGFPWWGWTGGALVLSAWLLAWLRSPGLGPWQGYAFTPLWLGYILVVNALAFRRTGRCLLLDRPRFLGGLFFLSAVFWWYFEYLNRFVQNWHYLGVGPLSPRAYFFQASLCFATVLPAVASTREWLASHPRAGAGLPAGQARNGGPSRAFFLLLFGAGSLGLALLGLWPDVLFPCLWVAPLMILTAWLGLRGRSNLLTDMMGGDWKNPWLWALAALTCGFFWEMWNSGSLAHWTYSIPYVERYQIFEMPVLGYAGYLPFGLECATVILWVLGDQDGGTGMTYSGPARQEEK